MPRSAGQADAKTIDVCHRFGFESCRLPLPWVCLVVPRGATPQPRGAKVPFWDPRLGFSCFSTRSVAAPPTDGDVRLSTGQRCYGSAAGRAAEAEARSSPFVKRRWGGGSRGGGEMHTPRLAAPSHGPQAGCLSGAPPPPSPRPGAAPLSLSARQPLAPALKFHGRCSKCEDDAGCAGGP